MLIKRLLTLNKVEVFIRHYNQVEFAAIEHYQ